jgi:hypothetical protein
VTLVADVGVSFGVVGVVDVSGPVSGGSVSWATRDAVDPKARTSEAARPKRVVR